MIALLAGAGLLAGGWAVLAAPGMPPAPAAGGAGQSHVRSLLAGVEQQSTRSEQAVLAQANAQGGAEIAALQSAQTGLQQARTQLSQAVAAEAAYRQAAVQAATRAQQLAAQLQAQAAQPRRGDDGGGDH